MRNFALCIPAHGIFADNADEASLRAGAARIVSPNTIAHSTNAIDVAPVLAAAIRRLLADPHKETA